MELDHALIAVIDLEAAAREFDSRHGLASIAGGRHPNWGTANRIVPLGTCYVELIAVVDDATAMRSGFGRWVGSRATPEGRPLGWAVRPIDLDGTAERLGLTVASGSRGTPSGDTVSWRSAGVDQAIEEPSLPFFMEWGEGVRMPGTADVAHPAGHVSISRLELGGDPARLAAWLGDHALPVVVHEGPAEVAALVLATPRGDMVL